MFFSEHPCKICMNELKDNNPVILCDLCVKWIHTACLGIGETQFQNLKKSPLPWCCPYCIREFPFSSVNNRDLYNIVCSSGPTNVNNYASPKVKKNQQKTKELLKKFR